ncbi:MAG: glutathione S-transferase family protein [Kofleriaceae bacterium]
MVLGDDADPCYARWMGHLDNGTWIPGWNVSSKSGRFERGSTSFRSRLGSKEHPVERDRYHLYVSYACPWAHRTLITRALRGLTEVLPVTVVDPRMGDDGWVMRDGDPDPVMGARCLHQLYTRADATYSGKVTVPVLWDKVAGTIVNNESREVMRMFDDELAALAPEPTPHLAPPALRADVDRVLDEIYEPINNGVYRAGFASTQEAYAEACGQVFAGLDHWEQVLGEQRYVTGAQLTEADIALFTTLLRFDLVYYAHFKCNLRRLQDYPNLWGFTRELYQHPAIRPTCDLDHIKTHYYWSQTSVNPHRLVPLGPTLPLDEPHGRDRR